MFRLPKPTARPVSLRELARQEDVRRATVTFLAGLVILLLMQWPVAERSFLGALDREMLDAAFKIRADVVRGRADPAVLLDIDDRTLSGEPSEANVVRPPPPAVTPRPLIANLLEFVRTSPPESRPGAVIVDVDLATPAPGQEDAVAQVRSVLKAWSDDPGAPPLIIAREVFPPGAMAVPGSVGVLPVSPYDDIVQPAPNVFWGSVKTLSDQDGVVREFLPYECARTARGTEVLYSSVLLAYGFLQAGEVPPNSPAARWVGQAEAHCRERPAQFISHGERINYHLSMGKNFEGLVWPELPPSWPGFARCGRTDSASFRRLSAADVLAAGPDASRALLCGRLVVIGGTNTASADFRQSPLNEMSGPVILINAVRGLQMSSGGLRQIDFALQVLVLLAVTLSISLSFAASRRARDRYKAVKSRRKGVDAGEFATLFMLNPVVLNWAVAFAAHMLGIGLLLISLELSLWGFLSAPAVAAAVVETVQEFASD